MGQSRDSDHYFSRFNRTIDGFLQNSAQQPAVNIMNKAEEYNARGNDLFKAGDYTGALGWYTRAVEHDNERTAKYLTNRANASTKLGKHYAALRDADSAIAADSSWLKGYFFKAISHEATGQLRKAMDACQQGLHVDASNGPLTGCMERLQQSLAEQTSDGAARSKQHQQLSITYTASVRDETGQSQVFEFKHMVEGQRLEAAMSNYAIGNQLVKDVTMPHYREMLKAKPWKCLGCQQAATRLLLHPMAYFTDNDPRIRDVGPTPSCESKRCQLYCASMARELMSVAAQAAQWGSLPNDMCIQRVRA